MNRLKFNEVEPNPEPRLPKDCGSPINADHPSTSSCLVGQWNSSRQRQQQQAATSEEDERQHQQLQAEEESNLRSATDCNKIISADHHQLLPPLLEGEPLPLDPSSHNHQYQHQQLNYLLLDRHQQSFRSQTSGHCSLVTNNSSPRKEKEEEEEEREERRPLLIDRPSYSYRCCSLKGGNKPRASRSPQKQSNNMAHSTASLISCYFLAELIGTFILVVIGDGTIAAYVLTKREIDLFVQCFAFGVGAMIATYATAKISGAHINPAASLAFACEGKLQWKLVPVYIFAQYLGGFLGALVLYINYTEGIQALDSGARSSFGTKNSTGHIFATYPGEWVSVWGSLLDQIMGTAVLLFSISAVTDKTNSAPDDRHQPFLVALVIGLTCVAFNPNCGAIFNPARDLAPRILTALFGYPGVWAPVDGLYWLTAGVIGPHIGAILGVFAYKLLIGLPLSIMREHELDQLASTANYDSKQQHQLAAGRYSSGQPMAATGGHASAAAHQRHHHRHEQDEHLDYGAASLR